MNLAAVQNLTEFWQKVFFKLGLSILIVQIERSEQTSALEVPHFTDELDRDLRQLGLGYVDSTAWPPGSVLHFIHTAELGKTLNRIKQLLATRQLAPFSQILRAESADCIRICHCPNPAAIGQIITLGPLEAANA